MTNPDIGIPWYRGEDWDEVKRVMASPESLHDTYVEWLVSAEEVERAMKAQGFRVKRVILDLQAFLAWCAAEGCTPDGPARARWAVEMAEDPDPQG